MKITAPHPRPGIHSWPNVVGYTCDVCLGEIKAEPPLHHDHARITHELSTGCHIGESGDRAEADVCRACFEGKIVPALAAAGLVLTYDSFAE